MENILERFPEWQSEIDRLCLENDDFQELCEDYKEVCAWGKTLADSDEPDPGAIGEYQVLLQDLEAEVRAYLNANLGPVQGPE